MELIIELFKFIIFSLGIVAISKYLLVPVLRKLSESLKLGPKAVGNITGTATSVPELLTVSFSAFAGFLGTSIYNIISSNVINLIQYLAAILLNKNQKVLKNKALKIYLFLVLITILIPAGMMLFHIEMNIITVIIFLILLFVFYYINSNVHKLYLKKQDKEIIEEEIEREHKEGKAKHVWIYVILLLLIAICLYLVGDWLSDTLTNLSNLFSVPEFILGIALGFITSLPELITFFEAQKNHHQGDEEIGVVEATNNLLTSNLLNLFAIQSIGIIIFTIFS